MSNFDWVRYKVFGFRPMSTEIESGLQAEYTSDGLDDAIEEAKGLYNGWVLDVTTDEVVFDNDEKTY